MFNQKAITFQEKVNDILLVRYYYIQMAAAAIHMSRYSEYSTEC